MQIMETIGGVLAFLVTAYLFYRQNQIMEEQNEIMRQQSTPPLEKPANGRWKTYWPMFAMGALTLAMWSAVGIHLYYRKPVVIEKPVEKIVPCPEQKQPQVQPLPRARPPKERSHNEANPAILPAPDSKPTPPPPAPGSVQQSNSGGINVQQGTTGQNSPIINSPITIGDVKKRITPADMIVITEYLRAAKAKCRIRISAFQNSNGVAFAEDLYKAFHDAGWTMADEGINEPIMIPGPGKKPMGVQVNRKGETPKAGVDTLVSDSDPLFYIGQVLGSLNVPKSLNQSPEQEEGIVSLSVMGLPE